MRFLKAKFACRVISRNSEHHWPPYSPDLTCLDFSFWPQVQKEVVRHKPQTLSQLKSIMEDFARNISEGQLEGWHATAGDELSCAAQNEMAISSTCCERKISGKKKVFARHKMFNDCLYNGVSLDAAVGVNICL